MIAQLSAQEGWISERVCAEEYVTYLALAVAPPGLEKLHQPGQHSFSRALLGRPLPQTALAVEEALDFGRWCRNCWVTHGDPLEHRSVFDDGALADLVTAGEAILLGAQRVGRVVAGDDDVVEPPEGAVLLHSRHGVIDVVLTINPLGLAL